MVGSTEPLKKEESKTMLILASLSITFWLPLIAFIVGGKDDEQVKFMAKQSLVVCIIGYILSIIGIGYLILIIYTILALLPALKGEVWICPVIGEKLRG